ncbi:MAG: isoamylase [Isosphaeraceae bacterium]|nr:isoamylase [Isosphaeraceae bacterium]
MTPARPFEATPGGQQAHWFRGRSLALARGRPLPLGVSRSPGGVNFAVIARHATAVWLVLSEDDDEAQATEILLDPLRYRTGDHWHVHVSGLPDDFCYGYRVDGPEGPGDRYDRRLVLLDPVARVLSGGRPWAVPDGRPRRGLVTTAWPGDPNASMPRLPQTPREDSILYELHVRGFTAHASSGVRSPGTYAGLIEKVPYLKELGVTAVELLPIHEFDELDCPFVNPLNGERLRDFWGYNTIAFRTPKAAYASNPAGSAPWNELRALVRAFHDARIEVVLDVVFNHTAERGDDGPTYSFRGFDNRIFYMLDEQGRYLDFTGCGNTVNSNHPVVRAFLLSCLRDMVDEAEVDGFRFDLASVFGRNRVGDILVEPPVVEMITEDTLLTSAKLVAEPWDAAGLYQVGSFPGGPQWSVWNGKYRDDVRRFWRGDAGMTSALATRLCGSDDLYHGRGPLHSINFVTCHDGFTLADLIAYDYKHNEANGEGNHDGTDANWSWNCGVEGPTDDPGVLRLRRRQARNLIATLMVSQGVPMLLAGDEFLRTQGGNNNAWCQDNATAWVDWTLADENADFLRFVRQLIILRQRHPALRRRTFFTGEFGGQPPDIIWHGVEPSQPDFSWDSRSLAFALDGRRVDRPGIVDRDLYVVLNAYWEPLLFRVPGSPSGRPWRRAVDTALPAPDDAVGLDEGPPVLAGERYPMEPRSLLILVSEE